MEEIKLAAAALVKAQKAFGPALKTHSNPAFKSRYADLGACIEAVAEALNDAGLALVQRVHEVESGVCVETLFIHESGQVISGGRLRVPATKNDPQGYGSALTYARRYSLMSACGHAPEDDDGNAAAKAAQAKRQPAQQADISAIVRQIVADAESDPAGTAAKLASTDDQRLDAIWARLPPAVAQKLTDNWPA